MDIIIQFIQENFVLIILTIGALLLVRVIAQKLLPLIGGIFVLGILFYAFTGDASILNKTMDTSTQVVDTIKDEVGTVKFTRTSETTFEVTTKSMSVKGDEATKLATVKTGEKVVEIPLSALYKLMPEDVKSEINMK